MGEVIQIDQALVQKHLGEVVCSTVQDTLNALLDAEADRLTLHFHLLFLRVLGARQFLVAWSSVLVFHG